MTGSDVSTELLEAVDDLIRYEDPLYQLREGLSPEEIEDQVRKAGDRVLDIARRDEISDLLKYLPGVDGEINLERLKEARDMVHILPGLEQVSLLFSLVDHFYSLVSLGYSKRNTDRMQGFVENLEDRTLTEDDSRRKEFTGWRHAIDWRYARLKAQCYRNFELMSQCLPRIMVTPEFEVDDTYHSGMRHYGTAAVEVDKSEFDEILSSVGLELKLQIDEWILRDRKTGSEVEIPKKFIFEGVRIYDKGEKYRFEKYFMLDPKEDNLYGARRAVPQRLNLMALSERKDYQRLLNAPVEEM